MDLKEKLVNIIRSENPKDPFTDVRLAKMLSTTRETVTMLRKELSMGNSRERRKPYLKKAIEELFRQSSKMTVAEATKRLMERGFDISRHVVEELLRETGIPALVEETCVRDTVNPFQALVGCHGSLEKPVNQAKSAILYPPFGLPTLIIGESGVGKTQFAECMYNFARQKQVIADDRPFIVFNCADYGDNPQLLLSLLYGYKKGAFTGADSDTEGLVEQAHNGVLFLDEIHRLPPKGQEILFSILDRGQFRRLGETKDERRVNIIFIGATTENIESSLLLSFRRRIPMIISIPSLQQRSFLEKVEIIYDFFQQECNRVNEKVFVEAKVIEILSLKRFGGNIGQLKSTIQVICARAFMKYIGKDEEFISIGYEDVLETNTMQQDFALEDVNVVKVRKYIQDMMFIPFLNNKASFIKHMQEGSYSLPEDFYRQMEQKYKELTKFNMDSREVEEILWSFIINKFNNLELSGNTKSKYVSLNELVNIVDKDIIELVKELRLQLIQERLYHDVNESIFTHLAIHLEETVKRIRLKQQIININLPKIKQDFSREYQLAVQFAAQLATRKQLDLVEDEIGFIAMYIKAAIEKKPFKNRVSVVVVSHGRIATEIVTVVKELLGVQFPVAIDMPLNEAPSIIYEKIIGISQIIDEGKGILFLVDMGSLTNVGKIVTDKLAIPTRTLDRVDLVTVIEAVRKASIPENELDEIYSSLLKSRYNYPVLTINEPARPLALVAVCLTGEGTACHIRRLLEEKYPGVTVFQVGAMDEQLKNKLVEIQQNYQILALIGTINPEIEGLHFIVYEPSMAKVGIRELDYVLAAQQVDELAGFSKDDLIVFESDARSQKELIEVMCLLMINKGYVRKEFLESVFRREAIAPTFMKGGIAFPHGDSLAVHKSAIVVARLKQPIIWGSGPVEMACLPAFKVNDKKMVKGILRPFLKMQLIDSLKQSKNMLELKETLYREMRSSS